MSNTTCETVKIKHSELPFVIINKEDFVEGEHELYEEPEVVEQPKQEAPQSDGTEPKPADPAAPPAGVPSWMAPQPPQS